MTGMCRTYILLNNSTATSPTMLPAKLQVGSLKFADPSTMGYYRTFHQNGIDSVQRSIIKPLQNQIDYKNGANLVVMKMWKPIVVSNRPALRYGGKLMLKEIWQVTGWVSYTLSKSERKIAVSTIIPTTRLHRIKHTISRVGFIPGQ